MLSVAQLITVLLAMALLAGCAATTPRAPTGMMDTPLHHYRTGMRLTDGGRTADALVAFDQALALNPEYGPALSGKGLALALLGDIEQGAALADDGLDLAATPREELWALTALVRVFAERARQGGMSSEELAEVTTDLLDDGVGILENSLEDLRDEGLPDRGMAAEEPGLYFYMAQAFLQALELEAAEVGFAHVVGMGGALEPRAEQRWKLIQKVRRAAPRTELGLRIALADTVTRSDMAALLVEELGVDRFFVRTERPGSSAFREPSTASSTARAFPADALGHPMHEDVAVVLKYGVRGLGVFPDGLYRPSEPLSRAEFALALEDVIIRATQDPGLATRYIGGQSPFPDLRSDHAYFNAALLAVNRGLLEADKRTGRFDPLGTVSGVDAVLAISNLRQEFDVL